MKIGFRKPSMKRMVKARTVGRAKRAVKRSVNPLYGKKGMGIANPKKAAKGYGLLTINGILLNGEVRTHILTSP